MASNINPYNVDGTFPIAGQDNSSQGFRDNFTNIKNNLIFAQNEINDLQSKSILTTALNGQTINNDMAGTVIRRPQLAAWTQTLLDLGAVSSNATLDFNVANFQKITTAGDIAIDFINWPTSTGAGSLGYGSMRVWIRVGETSGTPHTITLPTSVSIGVDEVSGFDSGTVIFDSIGDYIFDFSSIDGGSNYLVQDITRNHSTFRDPSFYFNDQVNSTVLIGYGNALSVALELEKGQDIVSAAGSFNSVSLGNLSSGNIMNGTLDTGPIAGYTVTSARGNLQTLSIQTVQPNDYLGYFNSASYTGAYRNGVVQNPEFQQLSVIGFYATGANTAYGLGGNIAFFTAQDGGTAVPNTLIQALGIENDQTVRIFGDLQTDGGHVERGTIITSLATTGAATVTANTHVSTIIIDSVNSTTIGNANIVLPTGADDKQRIRITSVAPIGNANVYAPLGAGIKFVPFNFFATGNVGLTLTYNSSNSTWYRS
jgi:hypothetical protein